ncbi:MAG: methylmalonyl-CoA mutase family protein [Acidimicrobiales bacterium]
MRIQEAATARTQARIDSGRQAVIGVNKYRLDEPEKIEVLKIDNAEVRAAQIAKLARLRAERDRAATEAALEASHRRCRRWFEPPGVGHRRGRPRPRSGRSATPSRRSTVVICGADPHDRRGVSQRSGNRR